MKNSTALFERHSDRRCVRVCLPILLVTVVGCNDSSDGQSSSSGPPGGMVVVDADAIPLGDAGSTSTGGGAAVASGSLGTPCEGDGDCNSPLQCNYDTLDYIGHKQCTIPCDSSDACEVTFGELSFCVGAGFCVRSCSLNTDCQTLTQCIEAGWCERGGPGSGIPVCNGVATACSLLSGVSCIGSDGCYDNSSCGGVSTSCYSLYSSYTCTSQDGCYWSSSSSSCSGVSASCIGFVSSASCGTQAGCAWKSSCAGVSYACDIIPVGLCSSQPGCVSIVQ